MKRTVKIFSQIPNRVQRSVHDTADGCRELAAADLARAALMGTANARQRLESSALSWTSRAELIQGLDDSFETRRAIARAEWEDGEAAPKPRRDPSTGETS